MKLIITVTDDKGAIDTEALEGGAQAGAAPDGQRQQTFDGGPVPDMLLSMESEVAAGQMPAPGRNF